MSSNAAIPPPCGSPVLGFGATPGDEGAVDAAAEATAAAAADDL